MDLRRRVILIDSATSRPARRSSLAHAVAHLDLGHVVIGGYLGSRQERDAEALAALRLISIPALADAISWCGERWGAVAATLDVDLPLLEVRLGRMHPAHRGELRRLLSRRVEDIA